MVFLSEIPVMVTGFFALLLIIGFSLYYLILYSIVPFETGLLIQRFFSKEISFDEIKKVTVTTQNKKSLIRVLGYSKTVGSFESLFIETDKGDFTLGSEDENYREIKELLKDKIMEKYS